MNVYMRPLSIARQIRAKFPQADVVLCQEVEGESMGAVVREMAAALGAKFFTHAREPEGSHYKRDVMHGLATFSRHRIVDQEVIHLPRFRRPKLLDEYRQRMGLQVRIKSPKGLVEIINVHLDTRINKEERWIQLQPVVQQLGAVRIPSVIAGDFNTAPFYWLGNVIPVPFAENPARFIRNRLDEADFTTPFGSVSTYINLPFVLDWMFVRGLRVRSHGLMKIRSTDHKALWMDVEQ